MKITRGQIRVLEQKTRGYVDSLSCELDDNTPNDDLVLMFHHIRVVAGTDGKWSVVNAETEMPINAGAIERCENDEWDGLKS